MAPDLSFLTAATGARSVRRAVSVQALWGGYGELFRVHLEGGDAPSVIVKWVKPPRVSAGESVSDARKRRSYEVELAWYERYASRCDETCRVPRLIDRRASNDEWFFVLEDLDVAGFSLRRSAPSPTEIDRCLAWLAAFHARFLGVAPDGLWSLGTYWHLATRREEHARIDDPLIREAAPRIAERLERCPLRTLVHGDAKPANFCFAQGGAVAAVDFQYVGGGVGVQDVAYFLSDRLTQESGATEERYLNDYFVYLRAALQEKPAIADAVERSWRDLYPLARADYYRFLAGWAKEYWSAQGGGQRFLERVARSLGD